MVSPDWDRATTRVFSFTMGSRYRNSWANSTSVGIRHPCSIADRALFETHLPLLWAQQSGHEVDQCRFSGAVLAEEAYNAAGREAECDVVEHLSWAIVIAKVEFMEFDHEMNDCSVMV